MRPARECPLELASSVVDFDPHSRLGDGFQKLIRDIEGRCSGVNCLGEHNPGTSFGFRLLSFRLFGLLDRRGLYLQK
jgi:hypothetical protein